MGSYVIYSLLIVLITFNQFNRPIYISAIDLQNYKNSKLPVHQSTALSAFRTSSRRRAEKNDESFENDKFYNLDNQQSNLFSNRFNEATKENLFLDNEEDDDQISASGDALTGEPDVHQIQAIRSPVKLEQSQPTVPQFIPKSKRKKCDPDYEFECWNGKCIERSFVCDGRQEGGCSEGEDELNCTVQVCNPTFEVQCKKESKCVNLNQLCDGIVDCIVDASDEQNCECKANEFQCRDRTCIKSTARCDNVYDCRDGSDELDCACKENEFRCNNSQCIPIAQRCDSRIQCRDASDELNCVQSDCRPNEFECVETRKCIPISHKCDGYVDCPLDFSDELNCFNDKEKCKENEFRCRTSGRCIDRIFVCDHIVDCDSDQSDEDFCWRCRDEEFTCQNGQCILSLRVCNGQIDCVDRSDESNCTYKSDQQMSSKKLFTNHVISSESIGKSKITKQSNLENDPQEDDSQLSKVYNFLDFDSKKSELKVREGFTVVLRCTLDDEEPVSWYRLDANNNLIKPRQSGNVSFRAGRLVLKSVSLVDAGLYLCRTRSNSRTTILSVEEFSSSNEFMLNDEIPAQALSAFRTSSRRRAEKNDESFENDKFYNLDNQQSNLFSNRFNEATKENLFLDNEEDDDQISASGDALTGEPDVHQIQAIRSPVKLEQSQPTVPQFIPKSKRKKCDPDYEFECWNGKCIERSFVCDGRQEGGCSEGEDELNCTVQVCNPTFEVQCKKESKCVNLNQLCDGIVDCIVDASDEQNCECKANEFQCRDRTCIKSTARCDNVYDCRDGSDELDCACKENEFRCNNSQCIPIAQRCDSRIQCRDASDELNCVQSDCRPNEFECVETRKCIPISHKCDGYVDCPLDFSDELNCFNDKEKCKENEFRCRTSGRCIDRIFVCDHIVDCDSDQSDEDFCWRCRDEEFTCQNGQCILSLRVCNGQIDCVDRSDESNCTYKSDQQMSSKKLFTNHVISSESIGKSKITKQSNLENDPQEDDSQLSKVYNFLDFDSKKSELKVREGFTVVLRCTLDDEEPVSWYRLDANNNLIKPRQSGNVSFRAGRLVLKSVSLVDAGLYLCRTRSNSRTTILSVEEFSSSNEFMLNDEIPAQEELYAKESSLCSHNEFACGNSNQCVSRLNHCDGYPDCIDRSDEIGCSPPMIVQSPERQVIATEGENVTLICKAIGTPTPVVTWRYNWQSIRSNNPRLVSSSNNGYGQLTIKNVHQSDTGKYICQGRNNMDTISAPFDTELIVKSKDGVCLPPFYNDNAKHSDQCIKCFCFNRTSTCYSSDLTVISLGPSERLTYTRLVLDSSRRFYRELPVHPMNYEKVIYNSGNNQFILNSSAELGESVIYWSLPKPFIGNLITSYGGFLKYVFNYAISSNPNRLNEVDLIIKNEQKNEIAYHSFDLEQATQPNTDNQVHFKLIEHQFSKIPFARDKPLERSEFLSILQNVSHFYVRAKFDKQFIESKLIGLELDVAIDDRRINENTDARKTAKLVEKCSCPLGYRGTSCESCDTGYKRSSSFHYGLDGCVREENSCSCNGMSNFCDPYNRCYNCQNSTEGQKCERCKRGFYGDPTRGIPCKPCNCPELDMSSSSESNELIIDEEWAIGACVLNSDDVTSTCVSCPLGTEGAKCQDCSPNYIRDLRDGKCRLVDRKVNGRLRSGSNNATCSENRFQCKENQACIPIALYCNGFNDCGLGSDEENCPSSPCDPRGSYDTFINRLTRRCDCKPFVTGERCDQCQSNSFNFGGKNGCTKCYCMGVSTRCEEKRVHTELTKLNPEMDSMNLTTIDDKLITGKDGHLKMGELDTENAIPFLLFTQNTTTKQTNTIFYWKLPAQFLGNKLAAYSGKLSYKIVFQLNDTTDRVEKDPDLILVGRNQEEIHYSHPEPLQNKKLTKIFIDLVDDSFTNAKGEAIRKDQLMNVLFDLNRILIKASYARNVIFSGIKEIELLTADKIEKCHCPLGYQGNSCNECSPGFFKKPGSYYHQCIPCDCNGNSKKCNPTTGECLANECEYNFTGEQCERCKEGFLLSRTRGFMECIGIEVASDDYRENMICNATVEGSKCDRCRLGFYNLIDGECTKCTCSGVTEKCRETFAYEDEITTRSPSLQLIDKEISRLYTVSGSGEQKFTFSNIPKDRIVYWQLPREFLGDQVRSYGSYLSYQLDIDSPNNDVIHLVNSDVEISSRKMTIAYTSGVYEFNKILNVPLKESLWERFDDVSKQIVSISKAQFLEILSDIQEIAVRAVYYDKQNVTTISNIKLGTVIDEDKTGRKNKVQTNIEQCLCPTGYEGSSCQRCASGFAKNHEGLCLRCNCNGHSNECRFIENGLTTQLECLNCLHNTEGRQCQLCSPQHYGDATLKTPNACKPCPCPSIRPSSNFASTCRQNIESGEIVCNCSEGYSGLNCGACSSGFEPDRRYPGRCRQASQTYRNTTMSYYDEQLPKITEATQTVVMTDHAMLRIDPNHLSQILPTGSKVLLRCVAQQTGQSNKNGLLMPVDWVREGRKLPEQSRQSQGILELFNAQSDDSGIYYCRTTDSAGSELRLKAHLVVLDDPRPVESPKPVDHHPSEQLSVRLEPRTLNVKTGESVQIRCVVHGKAPISINWYKSTVPNEMVKETRIVENTLVINSAIYADSGDYFCEAQNDQGTQKARSRLFVTQQENHALTGHHPDNQATNQPGDPNSDVIIPPSVHIVPERQTIIQGKLGQLQCSAEGTSPKITWTKARSELDPTRHVIFNESNKSILEIRNSTVSDRGLYVCRAENSAGMTQQSSIVEVERREIPAVEIYPSAEQMLPEHSSALFQCRLTAGIPTPTIEWRKADNTDLSDTVNVELLPGGVLQFKKLTPENQGKYICVAYNAAGRVTADAQLHVQGSINVRIKQTGPYRVRSGDRVKLDCELYGQASNLIPKYRIEWRKMVSNNSQTSAIQVPYVSDENNKAVLNLNSVHREDSGYYICLGIALQNNQVIVQERIQLIVEPVQDSHETTLQVEDRVIRAQVNEAIQLRCFVRQTKDKIKLNWLKRDSNLPINSRVEDGVLYIDSVQLEDDGIYVCTGKNERTKTTEFTQDIQLAVVVSPKIALTPALQSVKVGDRATVRCEVQDSRARIHWNKLNPDRSKQTIPLVSNQDAMLSVRNHYEQDRRIRQTGEILIIDNVNVEDQGYYLCTAFSSGGTSEATAEIQVTDPENLSKNSESLGNESMRNKLVQSGKTIEIKCPMRSGYYNVKWSLDSKELPDNAIANQYILILNNVKKSNEGRYVCEAHDERNSLRDRDYVYLTVQEPSLECPPGQFSCDKTCLVNDLRCDNKYDCPDMSDENGCESKATVNQEVELGGTLELDCLVLGRNRQPLKSKPKWYRMKGDRMSEQFSDNIVIDGATLTIHSIRAENAGIYRCIVDDTFYDSMVTIRVKKFSAPLGTTILMHCQSNMIQNVQNYHWKRQDSPLPENAVAKNNLLTIRNLNEDSGSLYTCIARNQTHRVTINSILRVTHIVPMFTGKSYIGLKHFSSLNSNRIDISFKIRNLTQNSIILFSGSTKQDFLAIIICNQHLEAKFELGNGIVTLRSHSKLKVNVWHRVKFKRHNLRALLEVDDQAEVEHIQLNKEKSVGLNLNDDYWYIGGYPNYTHLNAFRKLMIGNGLDGCISELKIDDKKYTLMRSTIQKNVLNCDTCNVREQKLEMFEKVIEDQLFIRHPKYYSNIGHANINQHMNKLNQQLTNISRMVEIPNSLCQNGGICQEALNHKGGVRCICPASFSGSHCEKFNSDVCLPDQCGLGGRCIDLKKVSSDHEHSMSINKFIKKQQNQFICDCGFGREGDRCQTNITIEQPRFTGERSFITYQIPRESSSRISILIKLKLTLYQPDNIIRDGLILYSAEKSNGAGDFISLSIKNQRFEFLFNTGSGVTIVQSDILTSIYNTSWYTVRLIRDGGEGRLILFDEREYVGYSPGATKGINLRLPLYLGDVDHQLVKLPVSLNDSIGFIGCVNRLEVNNQTIDLLTHLMDSSNIKNCKVQSVCARNPCKNGGVCSELTSDTYKCTCRSLFSGQYCEKNNGICATSKPCHHRGKCLDLSNSPHLSDLNEYKCCCTLGFSGRSCDIIEQYTDRKWANFDNSKSISYLSLENLTSLNNSRTDQIIELTFRTERFNGLLYYQGELDVIQGDYLMINLNDGYLEIEWQLGSGIGLIRSEESLNDGRKHQIIFKRKGQEGQLIVDISNPVFAKSTGLHTQLNVKNAIYLGGHKDIELFKKIKPFATGFSGCIGNLRLNESNGFLDLSLVATSSCNVRPCD